MSSSDAKPEMTSKPESPADCASQDCVEMNAEECAAIALSSWNEYSLLEQGAEYELVGALGFQRMVGPTIYHCNFIARPKNRIQAANNNLFFAELKYSKHFSEDGKDVALGCFACCILGPIETQTGLVGCSICELHPTPIHHPENGEFIKGRKDAMAKFTAQKQSEHETRQRLMTRRLERIGPAWPPRPLIQLPYDQMNNCPRYEDIESANVALSSWNRKGKSKQDPEYELVEVVGCKRLWNPLIYHCNFIARPKNDAKAEPKLFFSEVECSFEFIRKHGKHEAFFCHVCCILGPVGTRTGLVGCGICEMHPDLVQHPENGDFYLG